MKTVIIILSIFLLTWTNKANACDDVLIGGGFLALTNTIVFPLVGLKIDDRENPPYWRAVSYTFAASLVGGGLAGTRCENFSNENPGEVTLSMVVFGSVATYLTYRYSPRRTDKTTSALRKYAPQVSLLPSGRGSSIRLNWSF